MLSAEKEIELVEDLKAGSEEAFEWMVRQHQTKVYNLCYTFLKSQADAEDISQEVFVEIYRSIGKFRSESQLSTWIYKITLSKCLEEVRRRKRRQKWSVITSVFGEREIEEPGHFEHPGVQLENKERAQILFGKIDLLPENQKSAFILHKVEGVPYQEIADIMGISLASVESLIHRAKQNLKNMLTEYYQSES